MPGHFREQKRQISGPLELAFQGGVCLGWTTAGMKAHLPARPEWDRGRELRGTSMFGSACLPALLRSQRLSCLSHNSPSWPLWVLRGCQSPHHDPHPHMAASTDEKGMSQTGQACRSSCGFTVDSHGRTARWPSIASMGTATLFFIVPVSPRIPTSSLWVRGENKKEPSQWG